MISRKTLLASVAVAAATLAAAPSASAGNWYVNVAGGGNWLGDNSFSDSTNTGDTTFAFENDPRIGFVLSAAVGMHLNNLLPGLRVEGELAYRENDVDASWDSATPITSSTTGPAGTISQITRRCGRASRRSVTDLALTIPGSAAIAVVNVSERSYAMTVWPWLRRFRAML